MGFIYGTSNILFRGALSIFGHWEVEGSECVPPRGPVILASNHPSNLDPPLLAVSIPRPISYMAKPGLFAHPIASMFFKAYGAFPLDVHGRDLGAIQKSLRLLRENRVLAIFPEGTRSPNGMRKAIPGIAMIAMKSGAPILPVGITGTEVIGPTWQVAVPKGRFKVKIGEPFSIPSLEGKINRTHLESITTMIMDRVASLLPANYRGAYALKNEQDN